MTKEGTVDEAAQNCPGAYPAVVCNGVVIRYPSGSPRRPCLPSGKLPRMHEPGAGYGFLPVPDFIRYFGNSIKMLHLHDNNGFTDQHLIPAQGNIDWPAVFDALDEIGYDGYYNYELAPKYGDSLKDGIMFLGKLLREFTDKRGKI